MSQPLSLRTDMTGSDLHRLARSSRDAAQTRRLLALASIYEGAPRKEAARIGGVTVQIVRDWVVRFNERGAQGLINGKAPGRAPRLTAAMKRALVEIVESGPIPAIHGVVRWRLLDLCQWLYQEFRVTVGEDTVSRTLRGLGYRRLTARPRHHQQKPDAIATFKKTLPRSWRRSPTPRVSR